MTSCTCLCIWARVCERALLRLSGPKLLCFGLFSCMGDRGLSRKAPSNARGDDPFLGGFFFIFFRPPRRGGLSKPRQDRVFRLISQAEGRLFILRELAEFGYMKRFCTSVHSSRLVVPFWFPIRSGRPWDWGGGAGDG